MVVGEKILDARKRVFSARGQGDLGQCLINRSLFATKQEPRFFESSLGLKVASKLERTNIDEQLIDSRAVANECCSGVDEAKSSPGFKAREIACKEVFLAKTHARHTCQCYRCYQPVTIPISPLATDKERFAVEMIEYFLLPMDDAVCLFESAPPPLDLDSQVDAVQRHYNDLLRLLNLPEKNAKLLL